MLVILLQSKARKPQVSAAEMDSFQLLAMKKGSSYTSLLSRVCLLHANGDMFWAVSKSFDLDACSAVIEDSCLPFMTVGHAVYQRYIHVPGMKEIFLCCSKNYLQLLLLLPKNAKASQLWTTEFNNSKKKEQRFSCEHLNILFLSIVLVEHFMKIIIVLIFSCLLWFFNQL